MNEDQKSKPSLESSLGTLLEDPGSKWKFSDSGAGGSVLARNKNGEGVAVKVEHFGNTQQAEKLGKMMENFYAEAKGEQPFQAPRTVVFQAGDMSEDLAQKLEHKMGQLKGDDRLETAKANFAETLTKPEEGVSASDSQTVLVQEFAKGTQLNRLPTKEKMEMLDDPEFSRQLGKSMPVALAMGLGDHMAVMDSASQNNPSNLMYEPKSKTLSVIDYATQAQTPGPEVAINDVLGGLSKLEDVAKFVAKSPENYQKLAEATATKPTQILSPTLDPYFSNTGESDNFLSKKEAAKVTPEMKVEFAANFIQGTVEGLDYLSENKEALLSAAEKMHEEVNGNTVEHFYTKEQIKEIGEKLDQIKAAMPAIKAGMAEYQIPHLQAKAENLKAMIEEKTGGPLNTIKNTANPDRIGSLERKLDAVNKQLDLEVLQANKLMMASEQANRPKLDDANQIEAPDAPALSNGDVLQNGPPAEPELGPNIGNEAGEQSLSSGALDAKEATQSVSVKTIKDKFEAGNEGTKVNAPGGTNRSLT